jgi:hypothetical protein
VSPPAEENVLFPLMIAAALAITPASIDPSQRVALNVPLQIAKSAPSGVEIIRVVISPKATVASCEARVIGRGSVIDEQNCRHVRKLKVSPARDNNGEATYGVVELRLTWMVRRDGAPPREVVTAPISPDFMLPVNHLPSGVQSDRPILLLLLVGSDGSVEACSVEHGSGSASLDEAARRALASSKLTPLRDAAGIAVRGVQEASVGFALKP